MRPLATPVISFILGIVTARWAAPGLLAVIVLLLLSLVPLVRGVLKRAPVRTAYLFAPFFALGALFIMPVVSPVFPANHVVNLAEIDSGALGSRVQGVVVSEPEYRAGKLRLIVEAREAYGEGVWKPAEGRVLVTVRDPAGPELARGDVVRFIGHVTRPRNFSNPGEFDYEMWLAARGVFARARVRNGLIIKVEAGKVEGMERAASPVALVSPARSRVRRFIDLSDFSNKGLIKALVLGDKGSVPTELREVFVVSGTAHVLAISGLHLGFVAYFSYFAALWLLKRSERVMLALNVKKAAAAASIVPVVFYALVAGFSVSTQRATIMVAAFVVTLMMDRVKEAYNTLALAALIILVVSPGSVWDASFQLTFAAVIAIVYFLGVERLFYEKADDQRLDDQRTDPWRRRLRRLMLAAFITLAATVGTAPIVAWHFHRVSLVGFATNVLVVPLIGFAAVPLSLVGSFALLFSESLSTILLTAADLALTAVVYIVKAFAAVPYSSLWVSTPTLFEIALYYGFFISLTMVVTSSDARMRRYLRWIPLIIVLVFITDLGWWRIKRAVKEDLEVTFLNVGSGDSALVEFPGGVTMLIDGGGFYSSDFDVGRRIVAPVLWKKKIKKIDYMVLSHPQRDHMAGLEFIAANFAPDVFWWNGDHVRGGAGLGALGQALEDSGTSLVKVGANTDVKVINNVEVEFLHPGPGDGDLDINDRSLVMRLSYGAVSFLFTGDIGRAAEQRILIRREIRADVLKIPHHGSARSSGAEFIDSVAPAYAVLSIGWQAAEDIAANEAVARYWLRGVPVVVVNTRGAAAFRTDGTALDVKTYLTADNEAGILGL